MLEPLPLNLIAGPSTSSKTHKKMDDLHGTLDFMNDDSNAASDMMEGIATDIIFTRTPPWQKNSILSQHQPIVNQSGETDSPISLKHLLANAVQFKNVKQQPPWHDESERRIVVKKEPNFKEDPTGYLNHQTAILHNSILNLHSPEMHEEAIIDQPMPESDTDNEHSDATKTFSRTRDIVVQKLTENNPANVLCITNHRMRLSSMVPKPENGIQKYGKPRIAIGPNGQPVRIIQNTQHLMYAGDSNNIRINSTLTQQTRAQFRFTETSSRNNHKKMPNCQPIGNQSAIIEGLNQQTNSPMETTVPLTIGNEYSLDKPKVICHKSVSDAPSLFISLDNGEKSCQNLVQPQLMAKQMVTKSPKTIQYTAGNIKRSHESPVSSSTQNDILAIDELLPAQVGSVSTSKETATFKSPAISEAHAEKSETTVFSTKYHNIYMAAQTSGRNTITSVLAGKAMTSTTNTAQSHGANEKVKTSRPNPHENAIHVPSNRKFIKANNSQIIQITKAPSVSINNSNTSHTSPASSSHNIPSGIRNFPTICSDGGANQIIMTSTGQILMMPSTLQDNKNPNQMMVGSPSNNALLVGNDPSASNLVINTHNSHHSMRNELIHGINENGTSNMIASGNGMGMVIQSRNVVTGGSANILQSPNSSNNFIMGASSNMQSMILSNSGLISHNSNVLSPTGTTLLPTANNTNIISTASTAKNLSNANNLLASANIMNQQHVIGHNNQIISGNATGNLLSPSSGMVGQQTVLLNQLSNGSYVIQPQTITVDGQVMNVISSDGTNQFMQQRIIVSPDSKRRTIKRKSSLSPSTQITNDSPLPSPTVQQNSSQQMLQVTPHYQSQSFQISPGGAGITLVQNKPSPISNTASQQQILLQNSSTILQPINLIGQQLILPTGLMMAPDATTLLQIQNVASTKKEFPN